MRGVGGTRNCDWFFSSDGILLDTAGRYAVADEDRNEWHGFLSLLKKYRKKAPINGIIIAVSVPELCGNRPEFAISLAKSLRVRGQELTEKLEVHAPVYVMFTKADLIKGFHDFFRNWCGPIPPLATCGAISPRLRRRRSTRRSHFPARPTGSLRSRRGKAGDCLAMQAWSR